MSDTFETELIPGAVKAAMSGVKSSDLWKVPRDRIRVMPGFNIRVQNDDHKAQVRFIADSMKANGYFADKPLAGYVAKEDGENVLYVIDGHTRLEAVDLANSEGAEINEIPVVTKPAGTSMEDLTVALVVSNEGRHLSPYEVALVCKRLIGFGMEEADIARRIGKTRTYVSNLLLLASAPRALTTLVQEGKASATLAVETYKAHGKEAAKVLKEGLVQAQASGKTKVTGKHLQPSNRDLFKQDKQQRKSAGQKAPGATQGSRPQAPLNGGHDEPSQTLLERGIAWIIKREAQDSGAVGLLAHLSGISEDEIETRLSR